MSKHWKDILGKIAPSLGAATGTPLGIIAGNMIGKALLGEGEHSDDDIEKALKNATAEDLLNLKNLDKEFQTTLKELDIDLKKAQLLDVQDARKLANVTFCPQIMLSIIFIGGYFGIMASLMSDSLKIPEDHVQLITVLLSVLTAGVVSIMQYWFGSSSDNRKYNGTK